MPELPIWTGSRILDVDCCQRSLDIACQKAELASYPRLSFASRDVESALQEGESESVRITPGCLQLKSPKKDGI